jgi:hypothetical protein
MRTNFAEMPGKSERSPGAAGASAGQEWAHFKGDAVVRVSRSEEEAIGIGNCYRYHTNSTAWL